MIRAKNKFYKQLKLDKKTAKVVNFYRRVKEAMLKDEYRAKKRKSEKSKHENSIT